MFAVKLLGNLLTFMYLHVRKSKCRYQLIRASFPKNFCHINTIWKFGCSREDHDYCYVSCNERHQWQASVVTNTNLTDVNCSKRQRWQTLTVTNMDGNKRLGSRNYNQWINVWPSLKVCENRDKSREILYGSSMECFAV